MSDPRTLDGRDIVVTGAAGALGGAVVEALAAAGARLHLPVRRPPPSPPSGSAAGDRVRWVAGVDLTDEAAVSRFYRGCPALWASVHVAGGYQGGSLLATSADDLRKQLDLNLMTSFLCCREAARSMVQAGTGGRLVNVASRAAVDPAGGSVAYTVAKAAVAALTRALAAELKGEGGAPPILVNAVLPSTIDTAANRAAMPTADHARWPKPSEIAAAIGWLVSPECAVTSGALVPVYGAA